MCFFVFCKQKTAYEVRISDWRSDVCSSDLDLAQAHVDARVRRGAHRLLQTGAGVGAGRVAARLAGDVEGPRPRDDASVTPDAALLQGHGVEHRRGNARALGGKLVGRWWNFLGLGGADAEASRSEEHTSELQSLMRISYAVFCWKK